MSEKGLLKDVVIIRPLAIFLLVVWHSFIIYAGGGWSEPESFLPINSYWWIGKVSYACMLELFVFISGYVFAHTLQKRQPTFKSIVINKFRRLIIPSIIFSVIYYFMFYDLSKFTVPCFLLKILSGCGHMWFLSMLFWTTLIGYIILKESERVKIWWYIVLLVLFPILSYLPNTLRISTALYYTPFFVLGGIVYKYREWWMSHIQKILCVGSVLCGTILIGLLLERDVFPLYMESSSLLIKGGAYIIAKYVRLFYSFAGVVFIYSLVNYFLHTKKYSVPNWVININSACFGVYLFQQFILQIIYYKTPCPRILGPYWLPWVGLLTTLVVSYALTKLCQATKYGKQLM